MSDVSFVVLSVVALVGALMWLLLSRRKASGVAGRPDDLKALSDLTLTKHYQHLPQIRLALSANERRYLLQSAPIHVAKRALRERSAVARGFLKGVHEDFSNLERLGRMIAALSPVVSRKQETERLILSLKFHALYAVVWLRLSLGNLPIQQFEVLTGLVGRLAMRMEEAVAEINAVSARQLAGDLSP